MWGGGASQIAGPTNASTRRPPSKFSEVICMVCMNTGGRGVARFATRFILGVGPGPSPAGPRGPARGACAPRVGRGTAAGSRVPSGCSKNNERACGRCAVNNRCSWSPHFGDWQANFGGIQRALWVRVCSPHDSALAWTGCRRDGVADGQWGIGVLWNGMSVLFANVSIGTFSESQHILGKVTYQDIAGTGDGLRT